MPRNDPLIYLPRARIQEFPRRSVIYDWDRPPDHLYLVIAGRVKIFCIAPDGTQTLLRIACAEQFFGEASLVAGYATNDQGAAVIEPARVMAWTPVEIERHVEREPMLGVALTEYWANQSCLLRERLISMARLMTRARVAHSLIQLARCLGTATPQGTIQITGMTHQLIADYVGTSREIVTSELTRLRRLGYLTYSRGHLDVCTESLREVLWLERLRRSHDRAAKRTQAAGG